MAEIQGTPFTITVPPEVETKERLDRFLSKEPSFPHRSQLKQRIGALMVNDRPAKLSTPVEAGDTITGILAPQADTAVTPEEIALTVLFENENVLVVNKAAGMVVHPGAGNWTGTLLHALAGRYPRDHYLSATDPEDHVRPGIVHRLDKDTSGVMIVAKNGDIHDYLVRQFSKRKTRKTYIALIKGKPPHTIGYIDGAIGRDRFHRTRYTVIGALLHRSGQLEEILDTPSGNETQQETLRKGKTARTTYRVLRRFGQYTLVMLHPHTGRTHQLRVHLLAIGCPIVGDPLYARPDARLPDAPLMLHARRLEISIEPSGAPQRFSAAVPAAFRTVMKDVLALHRSR